MSISTSKQSKIAHNARTKFVTAAARANSNGLFSRFVWAEHKEAAAAFIETGAAKHLKNFPCDATKAPYVVH